MPVDVKFEDYHVAVEEKMAEIAMNVLEECAGELESRVKRNTAVDTGYTKNSWQHKVTGSMIAQQYNAYIGSDYENAIWEEFGTGDYALEGNGRRGGWYYVDDEGKGHFTHGKHPRRPFYNAYTKLKNKLIEHIQDEFKKGLSR